MDITKENFSALLPQISETIQNCDFIAIDTELSGLMREKSSNRFDLPEERFATAVEQSRGYFIMQFGLSCFTRVNDLHYNNKTYNFYIFPQANSGGDIDRTFSLQSHAIQFLTQHGFDFNKLFKHGVSYLTFQEKKDQANKLKLDMKNRANTGFEANGLPKFVPSTMAANCRDWMFRVKNFIEARKLADCYESNPRALNDLQDSEMTTISSENILELRDCTAGHKRKIMQQLIECLPIFENIEVCTKTDPVKHEQYLVVNYINKKLKQEKQKREQIIAKGFLEVIELMILNKKPIVGHNLLLDLIQVISQFVEPLSDDYNSFKETCHSLFPTIYDTKYIAQTILDPDTLAHNQSRLLDLYSQLKKSGTFPQIKVTHQGEFLDENQIAHQAGYDAFMSGYCFLALSMGYIKDTKKVKYEGGISQPIVVEKNNQIIEEFANKIPMAFSYDFKYYNLGGDDEEPDRDHIFYMEFPASWTLEDIFKVFYPLGGVTASRLNKTSALCALRDPKQTNSVSEMIRKLKSSPQSYSIYSYESYLDVYKPKLRKSTGGGDVEFSVAQP